MTGRRRGRLALGALSLFAILAGGVTAVTAQTVSIQGMLVGEAGQPLSNVGVSATDETIGTFGSQHSVGTRPDGTFSLDVPPAVYTVQGHPPAPRLGTPVSGVYVVSTDAVAPRLPASARVDARSGNVSGLVLQVTARPAPFVPDDPPRASLIQLSIPDSAGHVSVTGAPGSVPAGSSVFLITLDTGHVVMVPAGGDGSFNASTYAPPGTSIQIKADPLGVSYGAVFNNGVNSPQGPLYAMPGTILRVPEGSAASGIAFADAGYTQANSPEASPLPAWTATGTINSQAFNTGDTLRVQGTIRIDSPALATAGTMQLTTRLMLERVARAAARASRCGAPTARCS